MRDSCTRKSLYKKAWHTVKFLVQVDLYKFFVQDSWLCECVSPALECTLTSQMVHPECLRSSGWYFSSWRQCVLFHSLLSHSWFGDTTGVSLCCSIAYSMTVAYSWQSISVSTVHYQNTQSSAFLRAEWILMLSDCTPASILSAARQCMGILACLLQWLGGRSDAPVTH